MEVVYGVMLMVMVSIQYKNRAMRFYPGVHKLSPNLALLVDMLSGFLTSNHDAKVPFGIEVP